MELAKSINIIFGSVGALAAFFGALYALVKYRTDISAWSVRRRKRRETLDMLIDTAESRKCVDCNIVAVSEQTKRNADNVTVLGQEVDRSRRQRRAHDIALFAIVDALKQQGHNGYLTIYAKKHMPQSKKGNENELEFIYNPANLNWSGATQED